MILIKQKFKMEKFKKIKKNKINKNKEEDLSIISSELKEERKKHKILKEQNDQLLKDIITIKTNIRSLIPCLPQNKLYPFPSFDDLIFQINSFINNDSVKLYNRLLKGNQFNTEMIVMHFKYILLNCKELISNHFSGVEKILEEKFENQDLIKPLISIIQNSYQINWKYIYNKLITEEKLNLIIQNVKQSIHERMKNNQEQNQNINVGYSSSLINHLKEYIKISAEILIKCYMSQSQINIDLNIIGHKEQYNSLTNESLLNDNISRGEEGFIVIPSFTYQNDNSKKNENINKNKIIKIGQNENKKNPGTINYKSIPNNNYYKGAKSSNYFFIRNKYDKLNNKNNKINNNFRENKNFGNELYDKKVYSEIYFNSKSYANRNYNYYSFKTNNNSISNNYNTRKIHYFQNYKRNNKNSFDLNQKNKNQYIHSYDES